MITLHNQTISQILRNDSLYHNYLIRQLTIFASLMRLTAFIMAILILVLSCLPCADTEAMSLSIVKTEVSQSSREHKEHKGNDICSPFCHCSCCSTYSVVNTPLLVPILVQQPERNIYTAHISEALVEISLPVWQPPQLV